MLNGESVLLWTQQCICKHAVMIEGVGPLYWQQMSPTLGSKAQLLSANYLLVLQTRIFNSPNYGKLKTELIHAQYA